MNKNYIAHYRKSDSAEQALEEHLRGVGKLAGQFAAKLNAPEAGELLGILHDLGKYSNAFQAYIKSATGNINPDEDEFVNYQGLRGKIDHSTAGAQWIWQKFRKYGKQGEIVGQFLSLCLASHHSGLIDCLKVDGENNFIKRMNKENEKTHLMECLHNAPDSYINKLEKLSEKTTIEIIIKQIIPILTNKQQGRNTPDNIKRFYLGFWNRILYSCLIDADRFDSDVFENPGNKSLRNYTRIDWDIPIDRLNTKLASFHIVDPIDKIRKQISDYCKERSLNKQGIYSLTVPTGGGKTFSSLRFALHHARKHQLDRIIYVIPYTSIIEQNAEAIRKVVEEEGDLTPWVLEHHSNLEPAQQTWQNKISSENWDAPIVLTTMVQFLEVLFSGGTRGARRLHQLTNSVIIFDEIQTLPIKVTHMFCNAINFLSTFTRTTTVLCTATQPLLNELKQSDKGQLFIPPGNELVENIPKLFSDLKRVNINNKVRKEGWNLAQVTELVYGEYKEFGNCLVIVNTKEWARNLYIECRNKLDEKSIFHLSTNLCPRHRKIILYIIKKRLRAGLPILCISTQLIEAGVDIDFSSVVRFLA